MKTKRRKLAGTVTLAVLIIFIYINILNFSSKPADISTLQSMTLSEQIIAFLENAFAVDLNINISTFDNFVRKAAHFFEYGLLGFLVYWIPLIWGKKDLRYAAAAFLFVVILASIDEIYQISVPGRAGRFSDVIIDSAGCLTGMSFIKLIYRMRDKTH